MDNIKEINCKTGYEHALKNITGYSLRFWRDFLKDGTGVNVEDEILVLLYLNYFTLFAGRTGGKPNITMLENIEDFNETFISDKITSFILITELYDKDKNKLSIPIEYKNIELLELEAENRRLNEILSKYEGK